MKIYILFFICILIVVSCNNNNLDTRCPNYSMIPTSPYKDPSWNSSQNIIGFNHIPITEVNYINGYDCPLQAEYEFNTDSAGYWLINSDGTNQRRVLPYFLEFVAWSPDGKWIAFSNHAQICIMPFDGENFDTASMIQLTTEGRNFFPSWSPDGEWIAYDSDADSPTGLKFIWKMRKNGLSKKRIAYTPDKGETRMPSWGSDFSIVHTRYIGIGPSEIFKMDSSGGNPVRITHNDYSETNPHYSLDCRDIIYIAEREGTDLWKTNILTEESTQLTEHGCLNFGISANDEIVYSNYNYYRIDAKTGTLYITDLEGHKTEQLTYNVFIQSFN